MRDITTEYTFNNSRIIKSICILKSKSMQFLHTYITYINTAHNFDIITTVNKDPVYDFCLYILSTHLPRLLIWMNEEYTRPRKTIVMLGGPRLSKSAPHWRLRRFAIKSAVCELTNNGRGKACVRIGLVANWPDAGHSVV